MSSPAVPSPPQVLDEYTSKLYGILSCINSAEISLKAEPSACLRVVHTYLSF